MKLPEHQYLILYYFRNIDIKDSKNSIELMKLAEILKTDPIFISASTQTLHEQGYIDIREDVYNAYKTGKEGIEILSNGLPERKIAALLAEKNKPVPIKDVADALGKDTKYVGSNLKFLSTRGW